MNKGSKIILLLSVVLLLVTIVNLYFIKIVDANIAYFIGNILPLFFVLTSTIMLFIAIRRNDKFSLMLFAFSIIISAINLIIFMSYYKQAIKVN